jgi:uncharacterized protein (TIGR02265 family)
VGQEDSVPARNFEGLLLGLEGGVDDLRLELAQFGYDPRNGRDGYPEIIWKQAWELVLRRRFGQLPMDDAQRRMGEAFFKGFIQTTVGAAIARALPGMSPERLISQVAKLASLCQPGLKVEVQPLDERRWRMDMVFEGLDPYSCAGGVAVAMRLTGADPLVEVLRADSHGISLGVSW